MICVCLKASELKSSQYLKEEIKANIVEAVETGDIYPGHFLSSTMILKSFEPMTAS